MSAKDPLASLAREAWLKCAEELGDLIQEEYQDPKYDGIRNSNL